MSFDKIAIIDMGSNSIRLVINALHYNGTYRQLHNFKISARLSNYIDDHGFMTKEGMQIIIDTLQIFAEIISTHDVTKTIAVATAAVRNAKNREEIIVVIQQNIGITFRKLNEYEEAYYGYVAVVNSTNITDGITIDIGGGSTEITLFADRKLIHYHSFPFGVVNLKKQFIKHDPPMKEEILDLTTFLTENFRSLPWLNNRYHVVVGIGGTARNLSLIHQRIGEYPLAGLHQYEMTVENVASISELLRTMTNKERKNVNGLSKDRIDIIIPGVLTIVTFLQYVQAEKFVLSTKGLRDGLLYEEMFHALHIRMFPDVAKHSLNQLASHFHRSSYDIKRNYELAKTLYDQLKTYVDRTLLHHNGLTLLLYSSYVFYIGEVVNNEASSENTFSLLTNANIDGLSHQERLAIAFIASFKSRAKLKQYYRSYSKLVTKEQLRQYEYLGAILKMAYALDRTRRNVVDDLYVTRDCNDTFIIHLRIRNNDPFFEVQYAQKHKKHLEKILKQRIELQIDSTINSNEKGVL